MAFCKNHHSLYFDNQRRNQKAEAVLCLIHATYQAKIHKGNKNDIARMLKMHMSYLDLMQAVIQEIMISFQVNIQ